jgi:ribokinase
MTQKHTILTVGSLNMDQVIQVKRLPVLGETLLGASSLQLIPGGKGANQAVAMARLGASVSMAGRIGHDPFGAQLLKALWANKLETSLVAVDDQEASGVALIFLTPDGENAIVVASGANMCVGKDPAHMQQIITALQNARILVLQLEIPVETAISLIEAAHRAAVPVVLNLSPVQNIPLAILRQVEVLIINESEASLLSQNLFGNTPSAANVQTQEEASRLALQLCEEGIPNVVITLGSQGAVLAYRSKFGKATCLHQAPPKVTVIDTTAAGDSFAGAFTVALTENQLPAEALRFAVYASALKVTKFGAQSGLPMRNEVEALLHEGE